jgi:hypothetical protein
VITLERYVTKILRGEDECRPLWARDALESLARRSLARAGRPAFADPRHLAIALDFELLPRAPPGLCGEGMARGLIAYAWSPDPREVGLRVGHGLAHALLQQQFDASNDADAWVLTAMLLLPRAAVQTRPPDEVERCARAPLWFVREALPLGAAWPDAV